MDTCFFNECTQPVPPGSWKCVFHRHRSRCRVDDCRNQVYARNLCVRHGGKRQCQHPNCNVHVRQGLFCTVHGPKIDKPRCTEEGCTKQAHMRSKCVRHGGGRLCKIENCTTYARGGGLCWRHRKRNASEPPPEHQNRALPPLYVLFERNPFEQHHSSRPSLEPTTSFLPSYRSLLRMNDLLNPVNDQDEHSMKLFHEFTAATEAAFN